MLYEMRTESTLPWRRTGTSLRRTAGHDPRSTICPELVVLNVSGHLTGANQHSGPGISCCIEWRWLSQPPFEL